MLSSRMGQNPPYGTKPIDCKWVFKNKYRLDVSLDKHKERLVEKGFAQKEGVDYEDTFSPSTKWATIYTLFSMATQNGCEDFFLEWRFERECVHASSKRICCERKIT